MQNWLRRWLRLGQNHPRPHRARRPVVENLEDRCLLAAPVVDAITFTPLNIPANKSLFVPVTATGTDGNPMTGNPLTYTATSDNASITVTPRNNPHPFW